MATKMCDFAKLGRVGPWETRIFAVVFVCIVCRGLATAEIPAQSIPWISGSASSARATSNGEDAQTKTRVDRGKSCHFKPQILPIDTVDNKLANRNTV